MISSLKRFYKAAAVGAIPTLTLCLFSTLTVFSGNSTEFSASFTSVLLAYLPYMLVLTGSFGLLGTVMTKHGFSRYVAILAALGVLFWLQGNILVWDYGVLDGSRIDWLSGVWRGVLDLTIWIVVLLVAISAFERFGNALLFAASATLVIQLVNVVTILSGDSAPALATSTVESNMVGRDAVTRFSRDRNIVHIVMDGFQSDIFAEIIADTSHRDFTQDLRGFTFFQNNLGVFPYTKLTIPALLSGELYRNEVPVNEFIGDTVRGKTILNAAHDSGYEIDIAAQASLTSVYSLGNHTNAYGIAPTEHVTRSDYIINDSAKLIDLALFRVVPHFAKALVHRDELWVFRGMVRSEAYLQMQYFADLAFLSRLAESMTVDRDAPVYKLFHLILSHKPTVGNEQCEYDGRKPTHRKYVKTQARCGLLGVVGVLQRMKELGIYDSSLIILMADHGAWVDTDLPDVPNDALGADRMRIAMATPTLAIKPPDSTHDFRVSQAPTSIIDIPATIAEIANFETRFESVSVFSLNEDTPRIRLHLNYPFGNNKKFDGYLFPMQEYEVEGSPYDTAAWRKTNRYLPEWRARQD